MSFRKCHLQILRSLYDSQGDQGDGDQPSIISALLGGGNGANESSNGGDCGRGENGNEGNGDAAKSNPDALEDIITNERENKSDRHAAGNDNASESPVDSGVWVLIERFLRHQKEYRPHEQRQLHWSKVNAEAKSRLDHLLSKSVEEDDFRPFQSRSSLTPRATMFSMSGRGSMTSNLSFPTSQSDLDVASAIPSWNFINQMLQRRSRICNQSCQSYRSQPFLVELRNEAQMRCEILETVLANLKTGERKNNGRDKDGSTAYHLAGKRRKLEMDANQPTTPSLFYHLCSSKYTDSAKTNLDVECDCDEEYIVETKMKIHLWSSLLSSLKTMVDDG
ncbi:hypothetical protein ACHAW5_006803 [Stephanodiscus triporus]|uniref:Uncharacterized protein n=1 Tax=Stephanodiscus triporus TaxID=2934178 RepID=A0ABD3N484_9STRA